MNQLAGPDKKNKAQNVYELKLGHLPSVSIHYHCNAQHSSKVSV